jgi:ketosteroid isomerase-like protein
MPPDAPRRVGKVEIQRGMQPRFELFDTHRLTMNTEEVRILGDLAYAHGTYEFELVPKHGGQAKRYSGNFLDILEKQIDGSWKIAIDCQSFDTPWGVRCERPTVSCQ